MHRRVREIETLLRNWCCSEYGQYWLSIAKQKDGVIRLKAGQLIPVVHFIALGDRPIFIAPQATVKIGHRTVGPDQFRSGCELQDGEIALKPVICIDVVEDPVLLGAAARGEVLPYIGAVVKPSQVFSTPAHLLIAADAFPKKSYVLYQHIFGAGGSYPDDGFFYVGVTTRSWQKRWTEHLRSTETGSPLLFHRKLRDEMNARRVTYRR